jgi:hypothetical protein
MKKLGRFTLLAFFFVLLFILSYSIIPFISWVFGGSFKDVAQNVAYITMGSIVIIVGLGSLFNECFDEDFLTKD